MPKLNFLPFFSFIDSTLKQIYAIIMFMILNFQMWFCLILTEINKFWSYKKAQFIRTTMKILNKNGNLVFMPSSRFYWASEGLQPQASGNAKAYSFCKSGRAFLEHPDTGGHSFESWTYYKIKNSNIQIQEAPV